MRVKSQPLFPLANADIIAQVYKPLYDFTGLRILILLHSVTNIGKITLVWLQKFTNTDMFIQVYQHWYVQIIYSKGRKVISYLSVW